MATSWELNQCDYSGTLHNDPPSFISYYSLLQRSIFYQKENCLQLNYANQLSTQTFFVLFVNFLIQPVLNITNHFIQFKSRKVRYIYISYEFNLGQIFFFTFQVYYMYITIQFGLNCLTNYHSLFYKSCNLVHSAGRKFQRTAR